MATLFPGNSPLPASTPKFIPSQSSSSDQTTRVLRSDFGDGYTQRAADGINTVAKQFSLVWSGLTKQETQQIIDFFVLNKGYIAFAFNDPWDGTTLNYICEKWSRSSVSGDHDNVSADFRQVFDLGI